MNYLWKGFAPIILVLLAGCGNGFHVNYKDGTVKYSNDLIVRAFASSRLINSENKLQYAPVNMLDRNIETHWSNGNSSNGKGEVIEFMFSRKRNLDGLIIFPGALDSEESFTNGTLPLIINLYVNGVKQADQIMVYDCHVDDAGNTKVNFSKFNRSPRVIYFKNKIQTNNIKLVIESVIPGEQGILSISEIEFLFAQTPAVYLNDEKRNVFNMIRENKISNLPLAESVKLNKLSNVDQIISYNKNNIKYRRDYTQNIKYISATEPLGFENSFYTSYFKYVANSYINKPVVVIDDIDNTNGFIGSRSYAFKSDKKIFELFPEMRIGNATILDLSEIVSVSKAADLEPSGFIDLSL